MEHKIPDTRKQAVVALSLAATREPHLAEVREAVVASLAEVETASARAALRQALNDDVPEVSFAAAKALLGVARSRGRTGAAGRARTREQDIPDFFRSRSAARCA